MRIRNRVLPLAATLALLVGGSVTTVAAAAEPETSPDAAIAAALATLPSPYGEQWVAETVSPGFGAAPDAFGYVVAVPAANFADANKNVLLFEGTTYLQTVTETALPFTTVAAATADSITLDYRWLAGGDFAAAPAGGPVTYTATLTNTGIELTGTLPPAS